MSAAVAQSWPGETVVCLGSGPSLTVDDVEYCRGRARVIAIKDAIDMAPWADAFYCAGSDGGVVPGQLGAWWARNHARLESFTGLRFTVDPKASAWATVLRHTGYTGLELDPSGVRTGKNSGYQSINLAVHLGARRIVLLGFDMEGNSHYFGQHPHAHARPNYREFADYFSTLVEPLTALGIRIINASRETSISCFERLSLAEALA